ncbi:MAG: helix-turn-helix domain-containing protein [Clostridia bacterium]|nr:helix-turn-helix domain-containing protein [Clostridia bacterium]
MNIYFGENLRELRQKRKLTQEKLADFLNVTFQTVSKWERGENYPDICTLLEISSFFKVSVDDLLGVNRAESEEEIINCINEYDNLTDYKLMWELIKGLKEKYPNDFRVLVRYLACLVMVSPTKKSENEVMSIYDNIQHYCTVDRIRITAKRAVISYYHTLAIQSDEQVTFELYEKYIEDMPRMRDSAEMFSFYYPENHPQYKTKMIKALEEELLLFSNTLSHYYLFNDEFDNEFKIKVLEKEIDLLNFIYDDGNYSKMWQTVIYNYGYLGVYYHKIGDDEKALMSFQKCAELALRFDDMDKITVLNSKLFRGKYFNKETLGSTYKAKNRLKMLFTEKYPLSEDFKSKNEFKEILKSLG